MKNETVSYLVLPITNEGVPKLPDNLGVFEYEQQAITQAAKFVESDKQSKGYWIAKVIVSKSLHRNCYIIDYPQNKTSFAWDAGVALLLVCLVGLLGYELFLHKEGVVTLLHHMLGK